MITLRNTAKLARQQLVALRLYDCQPPPPLFGIKQIFTAAQYLYICAAKQKGKRI